MKQFVILCLLFASCSCGKGGGDNPPSPPPPPTSSEVTVLANDTKQVIQGFGCATAFPPPNTNPITSDEFDRLFGNNQIGLDFLRIRCSDEIVNALVFL